MPTSEAWDANVQTDEGAEAEVVVLTGVHAEPGATIELLLDGRRIELVAPTTTERAA